MEKGIVKVIEGKGRMLKSGGMWLYDNEIEEITGDVEDGDLVKILDFDGYFLGIGYINRKSKITVRLLSRKESAQDVYKRQHHDCFPCHEQ